jgi:hypothetical protein
MMQVIPTIAEDEALIRVNQCHAFRVSTFLPVDTCKFCRNTEGIVGLLPAWQRGFVHSSTGDDPSLDAASAPTLAHQARDHITDPFVGGGGAGVLDDALMRTTATTTATTSRGTPVIATSAKGMNQRMQGGKSKPSNKVAPILPVVLHGTLVYRQHGFCHQP